MSLSRRPLILVLLAAAVCLGGIAWTASLYRRFLPPTTVVMTTGPEGGGYRELGEKYRRILARSGVTLELRPSRGDVENIRILEDAGTGVSVGFVGGGLTTEAASPHLVSLGTIAYYPFWIFCRGITVPDRLRQLRGKRVAVGVEGSGTHALALELFRANELESAVTPVNLSFAESGEALLDGRINCACMLTTVEAPAVKKLLADKRVSLLEFERADAYIALYPSLRKVVVPEGVGSLPANLPPHDVPLIASTLSLVVREDLHPAIQFLLLRAADEVHSSRGVLQRPDQFPAPEAVDLPLSAEARSFYKTGGNFLQKHLPFWLWAFAAHFLLYVIPLVIVLYPLSKAVPAVVALVVDTRLNRIYGELRDVESGIDRGDPREKLAETFRDIEKRVTQMRVPTSHARSLYTLRQHLSLVRERLQSASPSAPRNPAAISDPSRS
ncbi:MAG TPA: TAXI family TRAP transporter solute-binding subunit [Thermoanaerobaculia bacterium]|nr:TAXI family TRAP transporter solute-binding subunit [Thermoanaerobaculia bacterium]